MIVKKQWKTTLQAILNFVLSRQNIQSELFYLTKEFTGDTYKETKKKKKVLFPLKVSLGLAIHDPT